MSAVGKGKILIQSKKCFFNIRTQLSGLIEKVLYVCFKALSILSFKLHSEVKVGFLNCFFNQMRQEFGLVVQLIIRHFDFCLLYRI
ncbi:MAG: hypothetical protein ACK521_10170 [bacterium]